MISVEDSPDRPAADMNNGDVVDVNDVAWFSELYGEN